MRSKLVENIRVLSNFVIPVIMTMFLADKLVGREDAIAKSTASAHINAGNYETAHGLLENILQDTEYHDDTDFLLTNFINGEYSPSLDAARAYFRYQHQESRAKNLDVIIFRLETPNTQDTSNDPSITTSLEKVTRSDGSDVYVLGNDKGNIYTIDGKMVNRTLVGGTLQGKMWQNKEGLHTSLIVGTQEGRVYDIFFGETTADFEWVPYVQFEVRHLFSANTPISELSAYDLNNDSSPDYFFTTKDGELIVLNDNGDILFSEPTQYNVPASSVSPLTIVRTEEDHTTVYTPNANGFLEYIVRDDECPSSSGRYYVPNEVSGKMIRPVLVGDINGDGNKDKLVMNDKGVMQLGDNDAVVQKFPLPEYTAYPDYHWKLTDVNKDGLDDLVYTNGKYVGVLFGARVYPLTTGWSFSNEPIFPTDLFQTEPVIADVNDDGKPELIVGSDESNVFVLDALSGKLEHKFHVDSAISRYGISFDEFNGEKYLTIASRYNLYMIGAGWFKNNDIQ